MAATLALRPREHAAEQTELELAADQRRVEPADEPGAVWLTATAARPARGRPSPSPRGPVGSATMAARTSW